VHADVAQTGRAQQRIGDGVLKDVCVGVAFQTEVRRDGHTAQNHRTAGRDAMDVPALAYAKVQDPITQDPSL